MHHPLAATCRARFAFDDGPGIRKPADLCAFDGLTNAQAPQSGPRIGAALVWRPAGQDDRFTALGCCRIHAADAHPIQDAASMTLPGHPGISFLTSQSDYVSQPRLEATATDTRFLDPTPG